MTGDSVYLLYHWRDQTDEGSAKLIGVFSSEQKAEEATAICAAQPGFIDHPDSFLVDRYIVDRLNWTEGFATVR
jgi:hypothetical protein